MHFKPRFMWKTSFLYIVLACGMLGSGIMAAHAAKTTNITIENPLGDKTTTLIDLVTSVTAQLSKVVLVIATFAIIVVGFKFVVAAVQGDSAGITAAKKNFMWVLIGTAVVVGAYALATAVQTFLKGL